MITANEVYQNWYGSKEKDIKLTELNQNMEIYKEKITDIDNALDDIRSLKLIAGNDEITLIADKMLDVPVIIENDSSYINIQDVSKFIWDDAVSRSTDRFIENAILQNNLLYVPLQNLSKHYNIQWNNESRTIVVTPVYRNIVIFDS